MASFALRRFDSRNPEHATAHDVLMREAFNTTPQRNAELRAMTGHEGIYFLYEGNEAVASISAQRCEQYINGKRLPCWMVAAVAVKQEKRGRGIGTELWRQLFQEAQRLRIPLVNLYPATLPFYHGIGFGASALRTRYKAEIAAMADAQEKPQLPTSLLFTSGPWTQEQGFLKQWEVLRSVYDRFAAGSSGLLARSDYLWARKLASDKGMRHAVHLIGAPGQPQGYLAFQESQGDTVFITDWAALNAKALCSLRHLLYGLKDRWHYAAWFGAPADLLLYSLPEHGYPQSCYEVEEQTCLMTRVTDVKSALENIGYPPLTKTLTLRYADPHLPGQSGVYRLSLAHGAATAERTDAPGNIALGPRGLAMLISHIMPASRLEKLGLLEGSPQAIAEAEWMFTGEAPWCADQY